MNNTLKMIKLNKPDDIFKSHDISDIDYDYFHKHGYDEVDKLFCDSSGFGSEYERALTPKQAIEATKDIIETNKNTNLYCGITGIGQFQVYITIFKREV